MYKRILAVGDIHGEWKKFLSLYRQVQFDPQQDLLIFLGDYIDRGLRSMEALDWMYTHHEEKNIIMLRGNHEQMMLDYLLMNIRGLREKASDKPEIQNLLGKAYDTLIEKRAMM